MAISFVRAQICKLCVVFAISVFNFQFYYRLLSSAYLLSHALHKTHVRLQAHIIKLQQPIYGNYRWASGHATQRFLISQAADNEQQLQYMEQVSTFKLKHVIFNLAKTLLDLTIFNESWTQTKYRN